MFNGFPSTNTPALQVWDCRVSGYSISLPDDCAPIQFFKTGSTFDGSIRVNLPNAIPEGKRILFINNAYYTNGPVSLQLFCTDVGSAATAYYVGAGQTLELCYSKQLITVANSTNPASGWFPLNQGSPFSLNANSFVVGNTNRVRASDAASIAGFNNFTFGNGCAAIGGRNHSAGGQYSTIAGGDANTIGSNYDGILGGLSNNIQGTYSGIAGGASNSINASGSNSGILGGSTNTISTTRGAIAGGNNNSVSQQDGFIGGGSFCTASGAGAGIVGASDSIASGGSAFIGGGSFNRANAQNSAVIGGQRGITRSIQGLVVIPSGSSPMGIQFGLSQTGILILARQTTDATVTTLTSNASGAGTGNQMTLPDSAAYYVRGSCIANVTGGGNTKAWSFEAAIKRGASAATTAIVGTVIKNIVAADAGAATWDITISADTTNGALAVSVTGQAATTIRWVCRLDSTEVTY
jgi:hypothetical protein